MHGPRRTSFSWNPWGQDVQPAHAHKYSASLIPYMLQSQMSRQVWTPPHVRTGDAPIPSLQSPGAQLSC